MQKTEAEIVLQKYLEGSATNDEKALLEAWYSKSEFAGASDFTYEAKLLQLERLRSNLKAHIDNSEIINLPKKVNIWPRIAVAASLLLFIFFGAYFLTDKSNKTRQLSVQQSQDIPPGGNKAILTLANGEKIAIGSAKTKALAFQGNTRIDIGAANEVSYHTDRSQSNNTIQYNTLTTPRGGQYPLTLSDGTKVWLDAASSITFPVAFTGDNREVRITGQAYFEVAHNPKKPFKVRTNDEIVEVLGTHFNINTYPDEPSSKTTLFEGSVKITTQDSKKFLKPGQQAQIKDGQISVVNDVDMDEALAWHNGLFQFHDADIQTVMRQLSRWYDVDISYEGTITNRRFSGKIQRNISALKLSDILSYKEINFRIEGKKIIVTP
ncbi:FecR family protein [Pedobacter sp. MR22-3]|uniref:FecR family protein n=1 Tax=Pedobacter sp. MR22-3 TaxID=2994552 RepID=UPI002245E727|nr:FecR domain-containing protein [Pedobacter sp. MR22-3]MCX2584440.1 FecR domain-containing protein [Pedobacter sp. MR22-3]